MNKLSEHLAIVARQKGVEYAYAIHVVAEQIWARCSVETKIWFAAEPGQVFYTPPTTE